MKAPDAGCAELGRATTAAAEAATVKAEAERVDAGRGAARDAGRGAESEFARGAAVEAIREAESEEELIMHLERDQFVAETSRPVARATLGRRSVAALWALRVFAIVVSLMVVYTFISQLH